MAEFTGMDTVEYDGDYELDLTTLTDDVLQALKNTIYIIEQFGREKTKGYKNSIVTIPITLSFETEVTIEVDPPDRSC